MNCTNLTKKLDSFVNLTLSVAFLFFIWNERFQTFLDNPISKRNIVFIPFFDIAKVTS